MPKSTKATKDGAAYAVIRTGAKQYRVSAGQKIAVELLSVKQGDSVSLAEVLLYSAGDGAAAQVGNPLISGASVTAKVLGDKKEKKVVIFKKRRRKGYTKKQGHRQKKTELLIESINL